MKINLLFWIDVISFAGDFNLSQKTFPVDAPLPHRPEGTLLFENSFANIFACHSFERKKANWQLQNCFIQNFFSCTCLELFHLFIITRDNSWVWGSFQLLTALIYSKKRFHSWKIPDPLLGSFALEKKFLQENNYMKAKSGLGIFSPFWGTRVKDVWPIGKIGVKLKWRFRIQKLESKVFSFSSISSPTVSSMDRLVCPSASLEAILPINDLTQPFP